MDPVDNEAKCKQCGGLFTKKRKWQFFCKPKCRSKFYEEQNPRMTKEDKEDLERLRKAQNG